ncbi:MAG TPA: hypothetical protein VI141_08675 [Acidimicrobiia bacterium]
MVRHHNGQLWISCVTSYRDWRSPLDRPHHWTPLFFLDDAVALAAGHRPCGLCRREQHLAYQRAVGGGLGRNEALSAAELNQRLGAERLRRGRGLSRAGDRLTWVAAAGDVPDGAVILFAGKPHLVMGARLLLFDFDGWRSPQTRPAKGDVVVLTPPTSTLALSNGFEPLLHPSAVF